MAVDHARSVVPSWPEEIVLRRWQIEAQMRYVAKNGRDFLCQACTASGKTTFGLYVASTHLWQASADFVIVVVPYEALRKQWAKAFRRAGIHLDYKFANRQVWTAADFHGIVVTYAAVASNPDVYRGLCAGAVLVIFDEPHHAGVDKTWGTKLVHAFGPAKFRLGLTGTPFRSDGTAIPFISYGADGQCIADYSYSYGDALRDGICRPVQFPTYAGEVEWWTALNGDQRVSLGDTLEGQELSWALRTALDPRGDWLPTVLRAADEKLSEIREWYYPDAGGVALAMDQGHARAIAGILRKITGEDPVLAISEEPDALERIEAYANGRKRWIVAVRMLTEGTDIPRLFVGVYATNILTELFFIQVVGRVLRVIPGLEDQMAAFFFPRVPPLPEYMGRIKLDMCRALAENAEDAERSQRDRREMVGQGNLFVPGRSQAEAHDVVFDHESYSQADIARAESVLAAAGVSGLDLLKVVKVIRVVDQQTPPATASAGRAVTRLPERDRIEEKDAAKAILKAKIARLIAATGDVLDWESVNRMLVIATGIRQGLATVADLEARQALLDSWLKLIEADQPPLGLSAWMEVARNARGPSA